MAMRDPIPWGRPEGRVPAPYRDEEPSPLFRLRQEVDRLFDDMFRSPVLGGGWSRPVWPSVDVDETDKEVRVTAELPGMSEKDIDLSVREGVLTIRGERKTETEDHERGWSERYFGRFERRIMLPDGVDEGHCDAAFRDGVLTVRMPKAPEAERSRRIPINGGTRH